MAGEEIGRDDAEALLETRRELGTTYDAALVDSFAERIEKVVEARSAQQEGGLSRRERLQAAAGHRQFVLGIVSLGTGIPITAISASLSHLPGVIVAWAGIAVVNAAHAWQSRAGG